MSKFPSKHGRDQALNFQGFLNDLQDWELSFKDKDKKLKPHDSHQGKSDYDPLSRTSSNFMTEERTVDATSEKDLGNECFKQKKFNEAIDCYSRSIALSPTAVAYANRAMAYLKIKRFPEAENDCTEALNLDDRYIKAYSRRATARKELRKLRDSLEDVEFALRLEPQNEELKKQRAEVKSLLEKAVLAKATGTATARRPAQVVKEVNDTVEGNGHGKGENSIPDNKKVPLKKSFDYGNTDMKNKTLEKKNMQPVNGSHEAAPKISHVQTKGKTSEKELGTSVQELASRAASRALEEAAKSISVPNSAYQFEVSWRGFSGDRSLQARLLKVTPPEALPQIFKNALTAPLLMDIIQCVATLFPEETELAVRYLENLAKVPRFNMIIMCLSPADNADLCRTWNEVFLGKATPIEFAESLSELHPSTAFIGEVMREHSGLNTLQVGLGLINQFGLFWCVDWIEQGCVVEMNDVTWWRLIFGSWLLIIL